MSNILKGIINEVDPHNYDSDWDYQNALARSGRSRSSYRSQEDDTSDADIAYSKKMYQLSQKQKRDADHDRLATGTNEDDSNQTRMRMNDYYDLADAIQDKLKQAIQIGNNELIQKYSNVQFLFVDGREECVRVIEKIFINKDISLNYDLQLLYDIEKL